MTILRAADIPRDELYLLPVTNLRRQIREDCIRPSLLDSRAELDGWRRGRALDGEVPVAVLLPAAAEGFVTEWQMYDEVHASPRLPLDREDEEPFDDEEFEDSEDEDAGENNDRRDLGGRLATVS